MGSEVGGTADGDPLAYWRARLDGAPSPPRPLPFSKRADGAVGEGRRRTVELDPAAWATLGEHATAFETLATACAVLVARLTGERDVLLGVSSAPTGAPSAAPSAAPSIDVGRHTVVLRVGVALESSFAAIRAGVRDALVEARAHRAATLDRVVEAFEPAREPGRAPYFGVHLSERREADDAPDAFARVDLALQLVERNGGAALEVAYDEARLDEAFVGVVLEQLGLLVKQAAAAPDRPADEHGLVTAELAAEVARLDAPIPAAVFPPVTELVAETARRHGELVAIRHEGSTTRYAQLWQRVERVAGALGARGVKPGDVVAVTAERSPGLVVAALGVLRAGGVLLLLDPALPEARRALMVATAGCHAFVEVGGARGTAAPTLTLPDDGALEGPSHELPRVDEHGAAYVFFTSGSTGVPKGVLGTHQGLAHFLSWQRDRFAVGPGDTTAQLTALSFDVVLRDLLLALVSGATLCIPPRDFLLGAADTIAWMSRERVTLLHTVPSIARLWLSQPLQHVPSLRWVFFAGEPLPDALVQRWRGRFSGQVANFYGPTETTLAKLCYVVPEAPLVGIQPVGTPLPDTQALVWRGRQTCGVGELGEIVIRTPFRSRGYLAASAEDAARFEPNPHRADPTDLVYRTGDLGRVRPDGALEIAGRRDHQVKVRGVRIELAEIEAVLARHPGVHAVAAAAVGRDDKRLVAYVVGDVETDALRAHARSLLPEAMVPEHVVHLDALPLLPNGKVDRRALPEVTIERAAYVAPRDDRERATAEAWASALDVDGVGAHDDFFALGGDSLVAMQALARLHALGWGATLRDLFVASTVESFAARLVANDDHARLPPLVPGDRGGELPLSAWQRPFFGGKARASNEHGDGLVRTQSVVSLLLRFDGAVDHDALERAFSSLIERHEALRTSFHRRDGVAFTRVEPPRAVIVPLFDIPAEPVPSQDAALAQHAHEVTVLPFDLEHGDVVHARRLRATSTLSYLLIVAHHIAVDAWGRAVLQRDLLALYEAYALGTHATLRPLRIQPGDHALWERLAVPARRERGERYWLALLEAAPRAIPLPLDRPTSTQAVRFVAHSRSMRGAVATAVSAASEKLFATVWGAVVAALHAVTGARDQVIATAYANRHRLELADVVGNFSNFIALRARVDPDESFAELGERLRTEALASFEHGDVPFHRVRELLGVPMESETNPVANVYLEFVDQRGTPDTITVAGVAVTSLPLPLPPAKQRVDLFFRVGVKKDAVDLSIAYDALRFDASTIGRLGSRLDAAFVAFAKRQSASVRSLRDTVA